MIFFWKLWESQHISSYSMCGSSFLLVVFIFNFNRRLGCDLLYFSFSPKTKKKGKEKIGSRYCQISKAPWTRSVKAENCFRKDYPSHNSSWKMTEYEERRTFLWVQLWCAVLPPPPSPCHEGGGEHASPQPWASGKGASRAPQGQLGTHLKGDRRWCC